MPAAPLALAFSFTDEPPRNGELLDLSAWIPVGLSPSVKLARLALALR